MKTSFTEEGEVTICFAEAYGGHSSSPCYFEIDTCANIFVTANKLNVEVEKLVCETSYTIPENGQVVTASGSYPALISNNPLECNLYRIYNVSFVRNFVAFKERCIDRCVEVAAVPTNNMRRRVAYEYLWRGGNGEVYGRDSVVRFCDSIPNAVILSLTIEVDGVFCNQEEHIYPLKNEIFSYG